MKSQSTRRREASRQKESESAPQGGYLLAEMILAMAVLSVAAAVVLSSFSSSLRAAKASENVTRATMLLQEVAANAQKDGLDKDERGDFGKRAPDFTWKSAQARSDCVSAMCPATLSVEWFERGRTNRVAITILAPKKRIAGNQL